MPIAVFAADVAPQNSKRTLRTIGRRLDAERPRFRFTLRAMLVVTTLLCLAMAYQLHWIRQRHAALADDKLTAVQILGDAGELAEAPWSLQYFGEQGQPLLIVHGREGDAWLAERKRLARLFPEAEIRQDILDSLYDFPAETPFTPRR